MLEKKLISTIASSRTAFDKVVSYTEAPDWEWSLMGGMVYPYVKDYYDTDLSSTEVDWDVVLTYLEKEHPKQGPIIREFISSLPQPASLPNILKLLEAVTREKIGFALMQALSKQDNEAATELMEKYLDLSLEEGVEEVYNSTSIESLQEHFTGANLIPIYPTALSNNFGGGVPRQSQICVYARPDVGKSVMAINLAVGAAESGHKVLYIGNEDPPAKMMYRILTRFTRQPEHVLRAEPSKWYEEAIANGYANMYFIPMHPGTYRDIRKRIEQIRPDVVVIDQIRNVLFDKDSLTVNLEKASKAMRNLAKEFNFVSVLVTQAGDSATEKLWLGMEDVDSSKTGLPGTMDLMLGLGQNKDLKERGQIIINVTKNKLSAPVKPITASIQYDINRVLA